MERDGGHAWIARLQAWAAELGFASLGVADIDLSDVEEGLSRWLAAGFHGDMDYMARHRALRTQPQALVPDTVSAVMVTVDYAPDDADWVERAWATLADGERAYVSRYALGRDYHKVVRGRLAQLARRLQQEIGPFGWRAFCDSAPVMEVELARRAGLGWRGKHTLLLSREGGSMRFLGTLYTDLPLPAHAPAADHCGRCTACIDACPTAAIVAPYRLDARRCVSYLTIEAKGAIPEPLRTAIGNRIYGCDDCQLACPWNKYAQRSSLPDFDVREGLGGTATLLALWSWDEPQWLRRTEGSAIRRIGWRRWRRNLAVALGNARRAAAPGPARQPLESALHQARASACELVCEHIDWALDPGV